MLILYSLGLLFAFFLLVIAELILFGSKVDPDDNGLLRTPSQRARYRDLKLKQREKNDCN